MTIATGIVAALVVAVVVAALVSSLFSAKFDPREPPVLKPTIPFFGHLIGMLREGPLYLKKVGYVLSSPLLSLVSSTNARN
jgi:hypothetical protein